MARQRRRSTAARSGPPRFPIAALLALLAAVAVVMGIVIVLKHQIAGYFTGGVGRRHAAVASATPSPVASGVESMPPGVPLGPAASPEVTPVPTGPQVAVIIDDCGNSEERCKAFLQLPIPITLSILPMTPHGKQTEAEALDAGKSVMLHLPMEPDSAQANPGPGAITTEMNDDAVRAQVEADIDSVAGVPGANNHMGSKATSDPRVMRDVLDVLHERHMFFIDSVTSGQTVGESLARDLGVPTAERDVFLDNKKDVNYILGQLKEVVVVAKRRGTAIAIGHPNPTTVQALAQAIPQMQAAGITFVNASSLVR
ncbi:MAG: divergent polysaccharide deacetylase family protein [Candidatus Eremiobacteraeota bacterium]|nr:divergent polysaccharide deacetylase family protein [Candidatus Eremiobacteraeota bacterium]